MLLIFLIVFVLLLAAGMPVVFALGGSAAVYLLFADGLSPTLLVQTTYAGIASFPLLAIPLFMLAGALMKEGGITDDLIGFAKVLLGHIRGGLGMATIAASAVFAAISGSAVATVVAVGVIMLPTMKQAGYDDDIAASVTATASCLGPIIPPSIPLIMYGVIANVSIASLFLGGIIPGLLLGLALMAYMWLIARRRQYPLAPAAKTAALAQAAWRALPALLMPVLILGGILGGLFTPTEAAGIAVVYAFAVGLLIYRRLKLCRLPAMLLSAGLETATVMLLLGLSEPFTWVLAVEQLPQRLLEALTSLSTSPLVVLLLVNIALLFIGIPLETAPALAIVAPVLAPLADTLGLDPVHLGVVICFNLVLGLITPPVGAVLFSLCGITGLSIERLSGSIWGPFLIGVGVLLLISFVPELVTFLPSLFVK